MKKVLSFILIFILVFQGTLAAFADTGTKDAAAASSAVQSSDTEEAEEEVISAEAEACLTLGIISEDEATVEYMKQEVTKLTAATMLLRLRGLYEEAKAYNGSESFRDADKVSSTEEKNILAYLKKNPQYGFAGDEEDNFNPTQTVTEQYYYRVLLEALGYKEIKEDSSGDFIWEDTLDFAQKVGLTPAKVEKATIDNLASAVIKALKANTADERVYINKLIEAGIFTKEQAGYAGIYEAEVKSAASAGNTLVKLEFNRPVDKIVAEDKSIYKIEGLETEWSEAVGLKVKSAKKMPNGRNVVILETSPQTCGQVYSIKYGNGSFKFAGLPETGGRLSLKSVREDTEESSKGEIIVKFDRAVDAVSATDINNYSFEGGTIEAVRMPTDVEVYFRVKGLKGGKTIKAKVSNITALDGSVLKSAQYSFRLASSSTNAQRVTDIDAGGNTRVMVTFAKTYDRKSAADPANYEIKSASGSLAVKEIREASSIKVELITEPQQSVEYELTVKNVADTRGNVMSKPYKKFFRGKMPTKSQPRITGIQILERNLIEVSFSSKARLDMESAKNVRNYTIDGDVTIYSATTPPKNEDPADFRKIQLKVSPLALNQRYTLNFEGIKDEYGNEIRETKLSKHADANAVAAAGIKAVKSLVGSGDQYVTQIELEFDKQLDFLDAMDISKIWIDGGIGHPVSSVFTVVDKKLLLDLPTPLISSKKYTVSIDGIMDNAGNMLKIEKVPFYATVAEDDKNPPEIDDVSAINKHVVSIAFDRPIGNIGEAKLELKKVDSNGSPVGDSIILTSKVGYDDDRRVEFSDYPKKKLEDAEYMIVGLSAKNVLGKRYELPEAISNRHILQGTGEEPEGAEVISLEQKDVKKIELCFSEKVKVVTTKVKNDIQVCQAVYDDCSDSSADMKVMNANTYSLAEATEADLEKWGLGKTQSKYVSNNRDYDWYIDQANTGRYSDTNCGPSCIVMASKWYNKDFFSTIEEANKIVEEARNNKYRSPAGWQLDDAEEYLTQNDIPNKIHANIGIASVTNEIDKGNIVIVMLDTKGITRNYEFQQHVHRFYDGSANHFIIVKGYRIVDDHIYFEAYDPNSCGAQYDWEDASTLKGKDRYYLADEIINSAKDLWDYYIVVYNDGIPADDTDKEVPVAFNGLTPNVSVDDRTVGYLKLGGKIKSGKTFKADLGESFTNMHGIKVQNIDGKSQTEITADLEDTETPYIENVEAIDRNTVRLTFNEGMERPGTYEIEYENSKNRKAIIKLAAAVGAEEDNKVLLTLSSGFLTSEYEYTLRVKADPVDYAGNKAGIVGEEYPFDGTDIKAVENYITKIETLNNSKIRISYYKALDTSKPITLSLTERLSGYFITDRTPGKEPYYESSTSIIINTTEPMKSGVWYWLYPYEENWRYTEILGYIEGHTPELKLELLEEDYIFTLSGMNITDTVTAEVYGLKEDNGGIKLDTLKTITINDTNGENSTFELNAQNNLILDITVKDFTGNTIFNYTDKDLKRIIDKVKKAYDAKESGSWDAYSLEYDAVQSIQSYTGLCKKELYKLMKLTDYGNILN